MLAAYDSTRGVCFVPAVCMNGKVETAFCQIKAIQQRFSLDRCRNRRYSGNAKNRL